MDNSCGVHAGFLVYVDISSQISILLHLMFCLFSAFLLPSIEDVKISRQGFEKRVVSQDLQLWLSNVSWIAPDIMVFSFDYDTGSKFPSFYRFHPLEISLHFSLELGDRYSVSCCPSLTLSHPTSCLNIYLSSGAGNTTYNIT